MSEVRGPRSTVKSIWLIENVLVSAEFVGHKEYYLSLHNKTVIRSMNDINPSSAVYSGLKSSGIDFVASVPCVNLQQLLKLINADPEIAHIPVTREEEGVGLCAGAWIGGKRPALLMQNSGLGNSINVLASLDFLYGIPLLMIISHRGCEGEPVVGQMPMGSLTPKLLDTMEIPRFSPSPAEAEAFVARAWEVAATKKKPVALLLDLQFWKGV